MESESINFNTPKPGDIFFVRMNNGLIRELNVSLTYVSIIIFTKSFIGAAEILETRTVDSSDHQEYFVHYLNCKVKFLSFD